MANLVEQASHDMGMHTERLKGRTQQQFFSAEEGENLTQPYTYEVDFDEGAEIDAEKMQADLREWVSEQIGPIAKPDEIRFAEGLPKTRSGKIMRRLLRTIAAGEEITSDISTLENEAVVEQLQGKA